MDNILHRLSGIFRTLARKPGFALAVVLILTLGIGANIATLGLIYRYFYAPLPYPQAQQLVRLQYTNHYWGTLNSLSLPVYQIVRTEAPSVQDAAVYNWSGFNLELGSRSMRVTGAVASASLFSTLGVSPFMGRVFSAASEQPGAAPVIVLSYAMWRELLPRDPAVIGKTLRLDNRLYTVIGVMPKDFWFPSRKAMFWAPLTLTAADYAPKQIGAFNYNVLVRLKSGADMAQLTAQANALFAKAAAAAVAAGELIHAGEFQAQPLSWRDWLVGEFHQSLILMQLATGLLILLAWFNLANLFVARALARRGELVLRRVLGASTRRLLAQLLGESLVLCAIGTVLGLLFEHLLMTLLDYSGWAAGSSSAPAQSWLPSVGFAVVLGSLSALVFSLAGFYFAHRQDLSQALREGDVHASRGRGERRLRAVLVVLQVALACSLCGMSLLLARSLLNLNAVNLGFEPQHTVTLQLNLPANQYTPQRAAATLSTLQARLSSQPGITAASIASHVPFDDSQDDYGIFPYPWDHHTSAQLFTTLTDGGYFHTLGLSLLAGRSFSDADRTQTGHVAVIDTLAAQKLFGTVNALGRQFTNGQSDQSQVVYTVIGIVNPVQRFDVGQVLTEGSIYLDRNQVVVGPDSPWDGQERWFVAVRTPLPTGRILPEIRNAAATILPGIPIYSVQSMDQRLAGHLAKRRGLALLVAFFSLSALLLAAVGLYAVQNYSVSQRLREFGIRAALGATQNRLIAQVLGESARLLVIGLVVGLAGLAAIGIAFASVFYGIGAVDPASMVIVVVVLALAALTASWVPAWRASRVAPAEALRNT